MVKKNLIHSFQSVRLATSTYCVDGRLKIEQNDTIAVVDGRPELSFIKGQNQRTFEIGTFPRNILEVLRFNRHGTLNTISRPVNGTFQHSAHGAATMFGPQWGSPSFLDSSYGGKVQLRQKSAEHVSKNSRQQRTVSEHFAKEKKSSANKQFSYNKLINDQRMHYEQQQQHAMKSRPKPERPPAPHVQPQEGILIDLSPEELCSMSHAKTTKPTKSCILDEPIEVPTEGFEQQQNEHLFMPPGYTNPPQYLNTSPMAGHDPFDTTHIENIYSNAATHTGPEPIYNNNPDRYTSDPHNLNASMVSLSLGVGNQNDNTNDRLLMAKKVEKQMLSEQLTGVKENTAKLNLELLNSPEASTTVRGFDPFSPVQNTQMFANNNFEAAHRSDSHCDSNIYNSVAGESIYAENFYDAVQSHTPSVFYESMASAYGAQPLPVSQYNIQQQQAIYDEVSAYGEMSCQPPITVLRPAPAPPGNSTLLSQQQINRRLEKLNQHGVIVELMNKLSVDNITESEAKEALDANNWNQDLATRYFKIDRLAK